ncbi:phage-associated protein, partial [Listeria seeligeri FSL N1-067]
DLIEKPAGKPTLVVETDKRQAIKLKSDAADDFADDLED